MSTLPDAPPAPIKFWIAVASADHVAMGRAHGFMQVCHGKAAPLRRLKGGHVVAYYAPSTTYRGGTRLQAFTALGVLRPEPPYQVEMTPGFKPWRRDVDWLAGAAAPIAPLLPALSFTAGQANWGARFRFGIFEVTRQDMALIANEMGVSLQDSAVG